MIYEWLPRTRYNKQRYSLKEMFIKWRYFFNLLEMARTTEIPRSQFYRLLSEDRPLDEWQEINLKSKLSELREDLNRMGL
jgi:hypothetical protein